VVDLDAFFEKPARDLTDNLLSFKVHSHSSRRRAYNVQIKHISPMLTGTFTLRAVSRGIRRAKQENFDYSGVTRRFFPSDGGAARAVRMKLHV
jgi:hypothetical protein